MVVGTHDGYIHLTIYDSFNIGTFKLPLTVCPKTSLELLANLVIHSSHPSFPVHTLLVRDYPNPVADLWVIPIDLRFVYTPNGYLSLLASKATQLQNLLRYVHQVQILMSTEWKAAQDLPRKFLANINETLAQRNNSDIVKELYHLIATGHANSIMKEWLRDDLGERVCLDNIGTMTWTNKISESQKMA